MRSVARVQKRLVDLRMGFARLLGRSKMARPIKPTIALAWMVLFLTLGIFSLYWLVVLKHHTYGGDYQIYLNAYSTARKGLNPYAPYSVGSGFVSHPIVMDLLRLLFFKDEHQSLVIWSGVSVGAWLVSLAVALYLAPWHDSNKEGSLSRAIGATFIPALFLLFGPFLEAITVGQIDTLALVFVLGSLLFSELDKPVPAGVSIGVAILIKTSPVVFLVYFVLTRRYRVVVFAGITAVVLTLLSGLPFPGDVSGQFVSILPKLSNEIHPTRYNLSLGSTVFRLLGDSSSWWTSSLIPVANKVLLFIAVGTLSLWAWRMDHNTRKRRLWLFACFQIIMVLFSPLVWYHHFVFLLFPLVLLSSESSFAVRSIGVTSMTLIQAERYWEAMVRAIPWPCLVALLLMFATAYVCFIRPPLTQKPVNLSINAGEAASGRP